MYKYLLLFVLFFLFKNTDRSNTLQVDLKQIREREARHKQGADRPPDEAAAAVGEIKAHGGGREAARQTDWIWIGGRVAPTQSVSSRSVAGLGGTWWSGGDGLYMFYIKHA